MAAKLAEVDAELARHWAAAARKYVERHHARGK